MKQADKQWFVADFETTGLNYYKEHGCTKVWLYAVSNSKGEIVNYGSSIDEFMDWCKSQNNSVIYFHNLRFDGSFILSWLLNHDYPLEDRIKVVGKKGFQTLIDEDGQFYMIKVNLARRVQVTFQDSLKIIPLKVKEIAKSFGLPIQKEHIDYNDYTIDEDRLRYVYHDVQIVAMALRYFRDNGFSKMTIGSNAYNDYKVSNQNFEAYFPYLDREWLKVWRNAYRGGRSQVNPLYAGQTVHNVRRYDINSMYPYAMSRFYMPIGKPILQDRIGMRRFELFEIDVSFKLKKGHLPTLLKKGAMFSNVDTYYTETEGVEKIWISNIDFELLQRHYDIEFIKFGTIYGFATMKGIFTQWVDNYYDKKSNSEGGLKLLFKLIINNLYGKFGSKCEGAVKVPYLDERGRLAYKKSKPQDMRCYYLPVAIAITSYCHKLIDDAILETGYDKFVYCDTDSVHTLGTLPDDWVDDKIIGKFKLEGIEETAKYVRQKCYVHKEWNGKKKKIEYTITCAGMSEGVKEWLLDKYGDDIFNEFKVGLTVDPKDLPGDKAKLRPVQVKGGTILMPIGFALR